MYSPGGCTRSAELQDKTLLYALKSDLGKEKKVNADLVKQIEASRVDSDALRSFKDENVSLK